MKMECFLNVSVEELILFLEQKFLHSLLILMLIHYKVYNLHKQVLLVEIEHIMYRDLEMSILLQEEELLLEVKDLHKASQLDSLTNHKDKVLMQNH